MKPIKIISFTPVWQRPEILAIHLKGIKRLQQSNPERFEITPFFIVSENSAARQILKHGYDFIMTQNNPLGAKKNAGLSHVYKNYQFDYIMEMGSDDLATNEFLEFVAPELEAGTPELNISNVYFIDTQTGETGYWETDKVLGAGRFISHRAITEIYTNGHKIGRKMWIPERNRGMDTCSWNHLKKVGIQNKIINAGKNLYTLDIKSATNINTLAPFSTSPLTSAEILNHFPNEKADILELLNRQKPLTYAEIKQAYSFDNILNKHLYNGGQ